MASPTFRFGCLKSPDVSDVEAGKASALKRRRTVRSNESEVLAPMICRNLGKCCGIRRSAIRRKKAARIRFNLVRPGNNWSPLAGPKRREEPCQPNPGRLASGPGVTQCGWLGGYFGPWWRQDPQFTSNPCRAFSWLLVANS
jgi:hypothetical protein